MTLMSKFCEFIAFRRNFDRCIRIFIAVELDCSTIVVATIEGNDGEDSLIGISVVTDELPNACLLEEGNLVGKKDELSAF